MPTLTNRRKSWIPKRKKSKDKKSWAYDPRYHTRQWRNYRKQFIINNPLCVECKKIDKIVVTNVVGHIIPVSERPDLFWEPANHKALCTSCNNRQALQDRRK